MYILLQKIGGQRAGDTMVLDSVRGHRETLEMLRAFLASNDMAIEFPAPRRCHLCPDWETLRAFRVVKSDGLVLTQQLPSDVLQVSARRELLARYVRAFEFPTDIQTDHHHPEQMFMGELASGTEMVIVEADDGVDEPETRIYADFNGLYGSPRAGGRWAIGLDTFGTLSDLARAGILLREGMRFIVFDESDDAEDLEGDGTVFFDRQRGRWFAELDESRYRYVPKRDRIGHVPLACIFCGTPLDDHIKSKGLSIGDRCPSCEQPIHAPLRPPRDLGWEALHVPGLDSRAADVGDD